MVKMHTINSNLKEAKSCLVQLININRKINRDIKQLDCNLCDNSSMKDQFSIDEFTPILSEIISNGPKGIDKDKTYA